MRPRLVRETLPVKRRVHFFFSSTFCVRVFRCGLRNVSTISVQKSISDSIYPTENIERGGRETTGKSAGERSGFHSHEIPDSSRSSNFTCLSKHARNSSQRAEVKRARKQRGQTQKKRRDGPLEKTLVSSGHASPWNKTQERPKKKERFTSEKT